MKGSWCVILSTCNCWGDNANLVLRSVFPDVRFMSWCINPSVVNHSFVTHTHTHTHTLISGVGCVAAAHRPSMWGETDGLVYHLAGSRLSLYPLLDLCP